MDTSGETSITAGPTQVAGHITLLKQGQRRLKIDFEEFKQLLSGIPVPETQQNHRRGRRTPRRLS